MGLVSGHWHFEIAVSDWITTAYIVITRLGIELRPANPTRRFVVSGTKFAYIGTDFGCDGTQFWTGNAAIAPGFPATWEQVDTGTGSQQAFEPTLGRFCRSSPNIQHLINLNHYFSWGIL